MLRFALDRRTRPAGSRTRSTTRTASDPTTHVMNVLTPTAQGGNPMGIDRHEPVTVTRGDGGTLQAPRDRRGTLAGMLLGSVSQQVVAHAACPVVVPWSPSP